MIKIVYIVFAFIALGLGGLGIILPGLPTTPFVLLAAGLFLKSSDKLYQKLLKNRVFGPYINRYMEQKGMTPREKIFAISMMWIMVVISAILIENWHIKVVLLVVALIGTYVQVMVINTVDPPKASEE